MTEIIATVLFSFVYRKFICMKDGLDDGSVEPKRYSVDFLINLSLHLDYLVIRFSYMYARHTHAYFMLNM